MAFPEDDATRDAVKEIFDDVGAESLTMKILLKRLAIKFKVDFAEKRKELDEMVLALIQDPAVSKKLTVAAQKARKDEARKEKLKGSGKKKSKRDEADDGDKKKHRKEAKEAYDGPKKPQSAFFLFSASKRPELMEKSRAENDGKVDIGAIGKALGALWGEMTEEEKAPFAKQQLEAAAAYEDAMKKYVAEGGKGAPAKAKKLDKPEGPKRAQSGFFLFSASKRPELMEKSRAENDGKVDIGAIGKAMGALWGEMTEEEKAPFMAKAEADKQRYEREMTAFKAGTWQKGTKAASSSDDEA